MADRARFDVNNLPSLFGVSNADGVTPVTLWADPNTHALVVSASISGLSGSLSNNNAAPGATNIGVLPAVANAAAPSYTEGNQVLLSTDLSGALRVSGSISVGGTTDNSAYTAGSSQGTPAMGFYHSTVDTVTDGRAATLAIDNKRNLFTVLRDAAGNARGANINASNQLSVSVDNSPVLGAGAAIIGKVGIDQTTPGTTNAISLAQIGATTVATGNGTVSAGVQRVAIASDNTAFSVNATLSAETTKVIGTVNIAASQSIAVTQATASNLNAQIVGTIASGSADSGNPVKVGAVFNTTQPTVTNGQRVDSQATARGALIVATGVDAFTVDTELPAAAAAADAAANPTAPFVISANAVFNGTTWDRNREIVDATNTTGTGIPATGLLAQFDDYSPTLITENQFGNLRMSNNRVLYGQIRDAAGNERGVNVDQSNRLSVAVNNVPSFNHDLIAGAPIAVSVPGVQIVSLADSFGNDLGSTRNMLNVYTRGTQDASEDTIPSVPYFNSALSTTVQTVKLGRTNLYYLNLVNNGTANAFVQVFDVPFGQTITLGTAVPTEVWFVPAGGCFEEQFTIPLTYINNLQIAATTTATGSSAPGTALIVNLRTSA